MISACAWMPPREQDMEDASVPGHPFVHTVDSASSVEAEDLFNNMHRIVITNLVDRDMWQEISMVNLNAHNVNPGAPEHLAMVNQLVGDNALNKPMLKGSNLEKISQPQWKNLRKHIISLSHPMTRCCFQCGMLNYPKKGDIKADTIVVEDIRNKHDCRAYRVFRYYIRKLVKDRCDRLPDEATSAERRAVRNGIFLCEPADGGGCRVFACKACKRLCRAGNTSENKPRYVQCSPADLDLFDGVDEENEFHTIGIGDRQPKAYKNLSCNDRMILGVLKV